MRETKEELSEESEALLYTLARIYAQRGMAREVAVLADAEASLKITDHDNWDGGTYNYALFLSVSLEVYAQLDDEERKEIEEKFAEEVCKLFRFDSQNQHLNDVRISAKVSSGDSQWRAKAKAWSSGQGLTNQGRVRSSNIASKTADGLLFRSQPEVNLYYALKQQGISFAPLAVFVRGGQSYQRMEPDFIVIKDGVVLQIEVDGDTVHTETPAEAQTRVAMLEDEGVHVYRLAASQCDSEQKAIICAKSIVDKINTRKKLK